MAQANTDIHKEKGFKHKKSLMLLLIALIAIGFYTGNNLYKKNKINQAIKTKLNEEFKKTNYKFVKSYRLSGYNLNIDANSKYQSMEDGDKYDVLHELLKKLNGTIIRAYSDNDKVLKIDQLVLAEKININYKGKKDFFNYAGITFSNGKSLNYSDMEKWSTSKPLNVKLDVKVVTYGNKAKLVATTNLPDFTMLQIILTRKNSIYSAQSHMTAYKGKMESSFFSYHDGPLESGEYTAEIFTPTADVLPKNVRRVIGQNGENMKGPLIQYDSAGGNQVVISKKFTIKNFTI